MNFKEGVQYKFVNSEMEAEFSSRYTINEEFADMLHANGGSFTISKINQHKKRVIEIIWANGIPCYEIDGEDLTIFDSEYQYFTEVGTSANVVPNELIMNLSVHSRSQAIAAIAALQSAYQC